MLFSLCCQLELFGLAASLKVIHLDYELTIVFCLVITNKKC